MGYSPWGHKELAWLSTHKALNIVEYCNRSPILKEFWRSILYLWIGRRNNWGEKKKKKNSWNFGSLILQFSLITHKKPLDICISMFYLIKLVSKLSFHPAGLMEDSAWGFPGLLLHRGASAEKWGLCGTSADCCSWLLCGSLEVLLISGALGLHLQHLQNSWEVEDLSEVPEDCVISWVTEIPHIFLFLEAQPSPLPPRVSNTVLSLIVGGICFINVCSFY